MPKPKKPKKATSSSTSSATPHTEPVQHRFSVLTDDGEHVIRAEYCAVGATGILALQTEEVMLAVYQPDHWRSCTRADASATVDRDEGGHQEPEAEPKLDLKDDED